MYTLVIVILCFIKFSECAKFGTFCNKGLIGLNISNGFIIAGQRVCKGKVCTAEQLDGSSIVTIVSSGAVADQNQAKLIDLESSTYGAIFTVAKTILNALLRDDK